MNLVKRNTKTAVVLLLSLLLTLCMGAFMTVRAETADQDSLVGYYHTESIMGISAETMAMLTEAESVDEVRKLFTADIRSDGTCILSSDGDESVMFWNLDGTKLVFSAEKVPAADTPVLEGTVDGDTISMDFDGIGLVLKKFDRNAAGPGAFIGTGKQETGNTETGNTAAVSAAEVPGVYFLDGLLGMDLETYASITGEDVEEAKKSWVLDLRSDGSGIFTIDGDSANVNWTAENATVTLIETADGKTETKPCTLEDGRLTLEFDGAQVNLKKDGTAEVAVGQTETEAQTQTGAQTQVQTQAQAGATYADAGYYAIESFFEGAASYSKADLDAAGVVVDLTLRPDGTGTMTLINEVIPLTWQDGLIVLQQAGETEEIHYDCVNLGSKKTLLLQEDQDTMVFTYAGEAQ